MNNYKIQKDLNRTIKKAKRRVIIHRHLFKNAGTTFDGILQNNFKEDFCDHREDVPMRKIGQEYLIQYLNDHPQIKALSSHHIWFNLPQHHKLELIPVIFLRHPIERMRSVYEFERKQDSVTLGSKMAKDLSFREYVAWYMKNETPATIRNFHTRHLAGYKRVKPLKKRHFKIAVRKIKTNPFIGVVDLFDQSLKNFDKAFRAIAIELDFSYENKNVSQPFEKADYELRAKEVLDELGDIAAVVLEKNAFDLKLYKIIRERVLNCKFHRYAK